MSDLVDGIIKQLTILSQIGDHEKLNTSSTTILSIDQNTTISQISRTFSHDTRDRTLVVLNKLYNEANSAAKLMMNSRYMDIWKKDSQLSDYEIDEYNDICQHLLELANALTESKKGLSKLYFTYKETADIASDLKNLMNKVDKSVEKIRNKVDEVKLNEKKNNKIVNKYEHHK